MQKLSQGVLPGSRIFFHNPGPDIKKVFFYPLCIGQFTCDPTYKINRNSYESFLLLYVTKGEGSIMVDDKEIPIKQDQIAIIDCYKPHSYQTKSGWDILWIHIDGPLCRAYYDMIVNEYGTVISLTNKIALRNFASIFTYLLNCFTHEEFNSDAILSKNITDLLTILLAPTQPQLEASDHLSPIGQSLSYIRSHFTEQISIEFLAEQAALSPYHFIRLFRKETGQTPHQYILQMRINSAKFYLRTTTSSIQEIAFNCGFQSENNFCICFKNNVNLTPTEYRNLECI